MSQQTSGCADILQYVNTKLEQAQWVQVESICSSKYVWPNITSSNSTGT